VSQPEREKTDSTPRSEWLQGRRRLQSGEDLDVTIIFESAGGREVVRLRKNGNLRGKRQDPSPEANDRRHMARCRPGAQGKETPNLSGFQSRLGRSEPAGTRIPGQEVSPECPRWQHHGPAPLRGRRGQAIVLANQRSVGELTAKTTRRVELGAKCQQSGKESVANSQSPTFSGEIWNW
jgi:hypothetical protein